MTKWQLIKKGTDKSIKNDEILRILLENRGIINRNEVKEFLSPDLNKIAPERLKISSKDIKIAINRIKRAKIGGEEIVIFGDYDADGITGTAVLWETLNDLKIKVLPYIPERETEGYGLSVVAIDNILKKLPNTKIIITVDNGIVANEAVKYANKSGIEVIITDHHQPSKTLPSAISIIHSTLVCGAAVAYIFSKELYKKFEKSRIKEDKHLELVSVATVTDVMPLTSYNRALLIRGLEKIRLTKRVGLTGLFKIAGIDQKKIGVYELGNVIGPRINAMGRIEHGIDSLRLICTRDLRRSEELARKVNVANQARQQMTIESVVHARGNVPKNKKIIFLSDKSYNQGIVGLISGRITEEFYKPSFVVSINGDMGKGSARSISDFNIIKFLRNAKGLLEKVGGHPGAAGFSVETKKIPKLKKFLENLAEKEISQELLIRKIKIDLELPIEKIGQELFDNINKLSPFGYGNPEPVFMDKRVKVLASRLVGKDRSHLKLLLLGRNSSKKFNAIKFGVDKNSKIEVGDEIDIVYSVFENSWNGYKNLELKIKDFNLR